MPQRSFSWWLSFCVLLVVLVVSVALWLLGISVEHVDRIALVLVGVLALAHLL